MCTCFHFHPLLHLQAGNLYPTHHLPRPNKKENRCNKSCFPFFPEFTSLVFIFLTTTITISINLSLNSSAFTFSNGSGVHDKTWHACRMLFVLWWHCVDVEQKNVPKKLRTYLRVCTTTRSIFQMKKRENIHMFLFLTKEYGQQ